MGFARDPLPIVGAHPERANAYVLAGFSGHGMSYAFRLSELLADAIVRGASTGVLDPSRFGADAL